MGASRRWIALIAPALAAGAAALVYRAHRRGALHRALGHVRASGMPSADVYDRLTTPVMSRFYNRVAAEIAALAPEGRILDVGAGPGRVAVRLATLAPAARVVGVDVEPDMVERATANAARAGVSDRAEFQVGDVGTLPFPDASFDVVISTLSLHHWPDPVTGLAEVHRVLKPGGVARIYDVADWLKALEHLHSPFADLVAVSPFGASAVEVYSRVGPVPLVERAEMKKAAQSLPFTAGTAFG
jgi:ubiquinone/menaquinone biosynthesis C-methylase UbiE